MEKIYIVLSYSGTIPSKIIKLFTHYKYSHVSISFMSDINTMYSFGRKKVNNPFNGGFIIETKEGDFYKKFNKTKCIIMEIDAKEYQYKKIIELINEYKKKIDIYRYDIAGIIFRLFNIKITRKNYSVCTEFVASLLEESNIHNFNKKFIRPKDFINIPNAKIIYKGNLLSS